MISTRSACPSSHRKQIRHWSLIRTLYSPLRSPFNASSLFEGGSRRSSSLTAASIALSLMNARCWISRGNLFTNSRLKTRSVFASRKDLITTNSKQLVYKPSSLAPRRGRSRLVRSPRLQSLVIGKARRGPEGQLLGEQRLSVVLAEVRREGVKRETRVSGGARLTLRSRSRKKWLIFAQPRPRPQPTSLGIL